MSRRSPILLASGLVLVATCARPTPPRQWPEPEIVRDAPLAAGTPLVQVEHPTPDSVHAGDAPVFLAGNALAVRGSAPFDVIIVIDVSRSTKQPADPDAPKPSRRRGTRRRSAAPEGSVLAVQVASARALLSALDPTIVRVGVVTFSGMPPASTQGIHARALFNRPPATTVLPLSRDRAAVETALDSILQRGPWGLTNMAGGLERAVAELVGGPGSESDFDLRTRKAIVFLTDGAPTLPYPGFPEDNVRAVLAEIARAAAYGIRIHSYGIGQMALEGPLALVEMADRTDGSFIPVSDPGLLPEILPNLQLGDVESLAVRNRTTDRDAVASALHPDGRWDALVSLDPGRNEIEIRARSSDGAEGEGQVTLFRRLDAPATEIPPALASRRAALDAEAVARREALRIELEAQVQRDRAALEERLDVQRKELELAPDDAAEP
jgi:hypothetical protein